MSDPFIKDGEDGEPKVPAGAIEPHVTSWTTGKLILIFMTVFAVAIGLSGAGTLIAIAHSNDITRTSSQRAEARNQQIAGLVSQLQVQEHKVETLTNEVNTNQAKTTSVLCSAIISSIKQQETGPTAPSAQQRQLTIKFLKDYGCKVPANL